jgi:hypothetical protein
MLIIMGKSKKLLLLLQHHLSHLDWMSKKLNVSDRVDLKICFHHQNKIKSLPKTQGKALEGKFWFSTGLCNCFLVTGDIYD